MVLDWPELVTSGQVPVESHVSGNIFPGVHSVLSLTQTIDGRLVWKQSYNYRRFIVKVACFILAGSYKYF